MERYKISVQLREDTGKGVARRLRREGYIPGVIYGKTRDSQSLIVNPVDVVDKINKNAIIDLQIEGNDENEETVMIKDYQRDVIKEKIIHVDFQQISMDEKIGVTVSVNLVGDSIGVKDGGVLQQLMRGIDIEALPIEIPDAINVDISELDVGDSLQVGDLDIPENVDIVSSLEDVVVTIVTPSEEIEEEEEELEEEFVEPEVIGEEGEEVEEDVEEGEEREEREE